MGTRFQTDINGGLFEQAFILHRSNGIHFGMSFATTHMVTFTDDFPVAHNHCSHHRVGGCVADAVSGQLYAAPHIFFVYCHNLRFLSLLLQTCIRFINILKKN